MYKIYINETLLLLVKSESVSKLQKERDFTLCIQYRGRKSVLLNIIDKAEKSPESQAFIVYNDDVKSLKQDFMSLYTKIVAAGGLVVNEVGEVLMIFRRGHWDLPKGKMESGEKKKETAIREVMEETGVQDLELIRKIGKTYHTYKLKSKKRAMKVSHWYIMRTRTQKLKPQLEEDIEKAEWVNLAPFIESNPIIYNNIELICNQYLASI